MANEPLLAGRRTALIPGEETISGHLRRLRDFAERTDAGDPASAVPPIWPEGEPGTDRLRRKDR